MKKQLFLALAALCFTMLPLSLSSCGGDDDNENDTPVVLPPTTYTANGVEFKMITVQGGIFVMGQESSGDMHRVELSTFSIGETEVTQGLWHAVMGRYPSYIKGDEYPVEYVSYQDCQNFIQKLNELTGETFRLPTEAEWEYAAIGGKLRMEYAFSGSNNLDEVAWYAGNSGNETHVVATKSPNELGLYDMSGNVHEWCFDWYVENIRDVSQFKDPQGPATGTYRVVRGGSWATESDWCGVKVRSGADPKHVINTLGLRLAKS
ncbi:MAG: SUMF1/EgtB/PvdO family nonheme iron enzyme [Bacteroidaceae bacterium]|nr:SUMF1/EgtB/PvdO family nonheme iron enzyme [Bacteroidaceae bacterium]